LEIVKSQVINGLTFLNISSLQNRVLMKPEYIQLIGIAAGILTSVSMLPQLIKIFREKNVEDLSLVMILVLLSGIGCWIYYGFLRKDNPIIYTNSFAFLLNSILLVLRFRYSDKK
jgi:Uncharacterized conserved protein